MHRIPADAIDKHAGHRRRARSQVRPSEAASGAAARIAMPYLGAVAGGPLLGVAALVAIFLPGYLLVLAVLGHWHRIAGNLRVRRALAAVNAAVVGLLAGAFYDPVWVSGITGWAELLLACAAFVALMSLRVAPHLVVLACALLGWGLLG